ncbi:hypothetical protein [Pantoea sp. Lij88]|uniref:hypothetical protein n=1 Tax=Pantoea sp. Lij88 TaxID=3028622 RepID=UPI0024BA6AF8|nr:hypothetical protein [Pantoea sp. Lij88]WHQ76498.1 hypothetical protein PU624_09615 [Pantoea sp. Lij88]
MSANHFVLLRVCIPDFFLPFPPTILNIFKEESLCPSGFVSVYMIYDKQAKKVVKTFFDCASGIMKVNELNQVKSPDALLLFKLSSLESNSSEDYEFNYSSIEDFEKFDFQVEAMKLDKLEPEYKNSLFLDACKNSILDQAFDFRENLISDFKIMFPVNTMTENKITTSKLKK